MSGTGRAALLSSAIRLSYLSIGWSGTVGALALVVAAFTGSLAVASFALSALLDASASCVLVWRFTRERTDPAAAERLERRAQAMIAVAMLLVALYLLVQGVRKLVDGSHADESVFAVVLAGASVVVLPWLGRAKLRVAAALRSLALRGDGVLSLAAAALAVITLLAVLTTSVLDVWWADPAAAVAIAAVLMVEAVRIALHHRFG